YLRPPGTLAGSVGRELLRLEAVIRGHLGMAPGYRRIAMYILGAEEIEAVKRVIESGRLYRYHENEDSESQAFEREWCDKIGSEHAIVMSSGTAALICSLVGMGIGPGDEVIVPAYTFMATQAHSPLTNSRLSPVARAARWSRTTERFTSAR